MARTGKPRISFAVLKWALVLAVLLGVAGAFVADLAIAPLLGERAANVITVGVGTGVVLFFYTWKSGERTLRGSALRCLGFTALFMPAYWVLQYALDVIRS